MNIKILAHILIHPTPLYTLNISMYFFHNRTSHPVQIKVYGLLSSIFQILPILFTYFCKLNIYTIVDFGYFAFYLFLILSSNNKISDPVPTIMNRSAFSAVFYNTIIICILSNSRINSNIFDSAILKEKNSISIFSFYNHPPLILPVCQKQGRLEIAMYQPP